MTPTTLRTILGDQRGVALAMALLALLVLAALMVAFSVLSATEPTIANNQARTAQARALAEAGLERTIWALTAGERPTPPAGAITGMPAGAPYDGSQFVAVSVGGQQVGGFRVTVAPGALASERTVDTTGWVPTDASTNPQARAHQRITVTVSRIRFLDPPCALCVRGDLEVSGTSIVDSRWDTSCGNKYGTFTTGDTTIGSGAARVFGADGDSSANGPGDIQQDQPSDVFDGFTYTSSELDILKSIAKSKGTYYQGTVTFNSSNPMPDGIIFVDTTTGDNITDSTPVSQFANVTISGNAGTGPNNTFSGWVVVNGTLSIQGNVQITGMVYAVNDLYYAGTGTGRITGLVVSQNVRDQVATTIDTTAIGNSAITYNCSAAKTGAGLVPQGWFVKQGSYREVSD